MNTFLEVLRWGHELWETGNAWARWAIRISLAYLVLVTGVALLGYPWLTALCTLVALAVIPLAFLAWLDPLIVAVCAAPERGRNILQWLTTVILGEVLFGLYLTLVPVRSTPLLVPILLVVAAAMVLAAAARRGRFRNGVLATLAVILVALTVLFVSHDKQTTGSIKAVGREVGKVFTGGSGGKTQPYTVETITVTDTEWLEWPVRANSCSGYDSDKDFWIKTTDGRVFRRERGPNGRLLDAGGNPATIFNAPDWKFFFRGVEVGPTQVKVYTWDKVRGICLPIE